MLLNQQSNTPGRTGTMGELTITKSGLYRIRAAGAKGGKGGGSPTSIAQGGKGALLDGVIYLYEGSRIIYLVGNAGTDHPNVSGGDCTSGAGGGGTYVTIEDNNSADIIKVGEFTGVRVKPLLVAAGGNGGADSGYSSGVSKTWHGNAETTDAHSTYASANYTGGGFRVEGASNTYNGKSFLNGGIAATNEYNRGGSSAAGFGGGGSNCDDGAGGGGGGWIGGVWNAASACSYVDSAFTSVIRESGYNDTGGFISIQKLGDAGFIILDNTDGNYKVKGEGADWVSLGAELNDDVLSQAMPELMWTDYTSFGDAIPLAVQTPVTGLISYTIHGTPKPALVKYVDPIDTTRKNITCIHMELGADCTVLVSTDNETWYVCQDNTWNAVEPTEGETYMTSDELASISKNTWLELNYKETDTVYLMLSVCPSEANEATAAGYTVSFIEV